MKIIVMSDSHRNYRCLERIFTEYYADYYIHLGDGEQELDLIAKNYPDKNITHVKGNCDLASFSQSEIFMVPADNCKIFATHGHKYNVKYSLEALKQKARNLGANVVLYGHTHERFCNYEDGLYIMNPGSASCPRDGRRPSFGIIDVSSSGIMTNIVEL